MIPPNTAYSLHRPLLRITGHGSLKISSVVSRPSLQNTSLRFFRFIFFRYEMPLMIDINAFDAIDSTIYRLGCFLMDINMLHAARRQSRQTGRWLSNQSYRSALKEISGGHETFGFCRRAIRRLICAADVFTLNIAISIFQGRHCFDIAIIYESSSIRENANILPPPMPPTSHHTYSPAQRWKRPLFTKIMPHISRSFINAGLAVKFLVGTHAVTSHASARLRTAYISLTSYIWPGTTVTTISRLGEHITTMTSHFHTDYSYMVYIIESLRYALRKYFVCYWFQKAA